MTGNFPYRWKVALWSVCVSGSVLLIFIVSSALLVYDNMLEEADHEVKIHADRLIKEAKKGDFEAARKRFPKQGAISAEKASLRLIEFRGKRVKTPVVNKEWPGKFEIEEGKGKRFETIKFEGMHWRVMSYRDSGYETRMAIALKEIYDEVNRMARTQLFVLPLALAFIALGGWWMAGKAAGPVAALTQTAENITVQGLDQRLPEINQNDELGRLIRVFNRMMDRLQLSYQQAIRFSSDASHELRTPLTILQGKLESALQEPRDEATVEMLGDLSEQTQRLKSIVDSLLLFSQCDSGRLKIQGGAVDLREMLQGLQEDVEFLAEGQEEKIGLDFQIEDRLVVDGDRHLLGMAAFNLLQNAIKFNLPTEGKIICSLIRMGNRAVIRVANTGITIPDNERERIFDRFYRTEQQSKVPGFGLGLSLAGVIAKAHGGTIRLVDGEEGWNIFEMEIPAITLSDRV